MSPTVKKKRSKKRLLAGIAGGITLGGLAYGVYSMSKHKKNNEDSNQDSNANATDTSGTSEEEGSSSSSGTSSDSSSSKTVKKTVVEEIPITNYNEAYDFAVREWNKIKRGNGRALECQTLGATQWKTGEWCKVYLPSFDIDGYMYIIRVSQTSEGGDWTSNISLVDYPPGWGKEEVKTDEEDTDDKNESSEECNDTTNTDDSSKTTTDDTGNTNTSTSTSTSS